MADNLERRLEAIKVATALPRWKLLNHAATIGPFEAGEAANIADLPPESGNARSTHAERLCSVNLLEREPGRHVGYRITSDGLALHNDLAAVLDTRNDQDPRARSLLPGELIDLVAEVAGGGEKHHQPVILRVTRQL